MEFNPVFRKNFFVDWYKSHGRDFPWRWESVSPFALLITEMLLRQTQAMAVSKLWTEFIEKYPDARTLAQANKVELFDQLKILGLGEQRASALVGAADWLVDHYEGQVPRIKEELLKIPHVGAYVSNAILCFAFGYKVEVVDTNILRFYARYYGLVVKPDIRRNPEVWKIARLSLPNEINEVKQHNYGLLDFTADICKSRVPRCGDCPLVSTCKWGTRQIPLFNKNAIDG
jgi:A/G-specific adenine glycosylase